ncbi:MAG: ATP-binding protein [Pirellulaceae bacterium]|nr:ATP-binding protein [Pirellulaceae bacterium]
MSGTRERVAVNVGWLIKLRWVAVVGQFVTILGASLFLGIKLLIWPVFVVIGLTILSNALLIYWMGRDDGLDLGESGRFFENVLGWVMTMDMLSLATLLYVSGGPSNPFWLFFFVNLSLSAVVLGRTWAWTLNLVSILCFCGLLYSHLPIDELNMGLSLLPVAEKGNWSLIQQGLLIAFATCSSVIVYFMTRVTGALRQQELDLRSAQETRSRNEKLEALGTLAAGAAHELSTPLTTIALVAKDVEQALNQQGSTDEDMIEDVGLIRQQLDRCKSILDRMASHAGETVGEMMQRTTIANFFDDVCEGLTSDEDCITVKYIHDSQNHQIEVPVDALSQAIRALLQNALDASTSDPNVEVRISRNDNRMIWAIQDHGTGMSPDVLRRVSEPFFTTKSPGKGMGLGVFLARNVIEELGGSVRFQSSDDPFLPTGTTVTVTLPCVCKFEPQNIGEDA